ncbi:MAG: sodium:solute symporter [Lewinellaceae bacterium]|nr:sodium:solute symporter [Lewinellaceae bacterium]
MSPILLFGFVFGYFALLLGVAYYTSKNSDNASFFIGNRNSHWLLVAFGMVGTSLSGVTFVSVPGTVGSIGFGYYQVVIGYFIGYIVVAYVLLPLYYKMNLTSIYRYLDERFGPRAYKTGALFFLVSRTLGATARMYLVINILQIFILKSMGIPFGVTAAIILLLILLYTFEGGVKTIVYTDTLQTTFMLLGLVVSIFAILSSLNITTNEAWQTLASKGLTKIYNGDAYSASFFWKQVLGGAFITITMTGMDQEMMQKNISVRTLGGSQKNMVTLATILLIVNGLFLFLGGLLFLFAESNGLNLKGDDLFPTIALGGTLSVSVAIIFIIGLISALFPSADGALTAMTSSFCIDILGMEKNTAQSEAQKKATRLKVHLTFAFIFLLCILMFKWIDDKSIIDVILKLAGYTYGPLLGLFSFGILTHRLVNDRWVLLVCLLSPLVILGIDFINNPEWFGSKLGFAQDTITSLSHLSQRLFSGFKIGIEILILNGILTFIGLWFISKPRESSAHA